MPNILNLVKVVYRRSMYMYVVSQCRKNIYSWNGNLLPWCFSTHSGFYHASSYLQQLTKAFESFIQQGFNHPPLVTFLYGQVSTEHHFYPPLEDDIGFNDVVPDMQHTTKPISLVQVVPQISDHDEHLLAPHEHARNSNMQGRRNRITTQNTGGIY